MARRDVSEGLPVGHAHSLGGHESFLLGEAASAGWNSYFPIVATYKVPIGLGPGARPGPGVGGPDYAAVGRMRPVPPCLAWAAFLINSRVNIGFRHFLPLVLSPWPSPPMPGRPGRAWTALAWAGVAVAALHAASLHPDYLSYINFPRHKPYLAISDSNVDWGQSLKQVRRWLDARPPDGRPIHLNISATPNSTSAITWATASSCSRRRRRPAPNRLAAGQPGLRGRRVRPRRNLSGA